MQEVRARKHLKKQRRQERPAVARYFDDEAQEGTDDEELHEGHVGSKHKSKKAHQMVKEQYYDRSELLKKTKT